jgi:hypothetical protein
MSLLSILRNGLCPYRNWSEIAVKNIGGAKSNGRPISRPDGIPDSLIIFWIDNMQLIKAALSDLNFHSLFDYHSRISDRLSHQQVKMYVQRIKMENHEQKCVMKFLFLQGKRSKVRHGELSGVLREAALSLITVKRECWRFKDGNF